MTAKEARAAAVAIDERINLVERIRDVHGTHPAFYILGRCYTTKKGVAFSVEVRGVGPSWVAALADMNIRIREGR